jgi:hypothetical protein
MLRNIGQRAIMAERRDPLDPFGRNAMRRSRAVLEQAAQNRAVDLSTKLMVERPRGASAKATRHPIQSQPVWTLSRALPLLV